MPSPSISSCAEDCICPFPSLCVPAGVAANLTCMATTEQRARRRGCWVAEGSLWRWLLRRSAEKGVPVCPRTFLSETWTAAFNALDSRRLEVVANGLTLFGGAQLAIDTTLVSPLHRDGTARRRAAHVNGAALEVARRRKERTYPELAGDQGRARLVVLAAEVGGRWNTETAQFISALAKARSTSVPEFLQARVEAAWIRRWSAILACSAARAFSLSLLDQRPVPRMCEIPSSHEVLRDDRFA